MSPGSSSDLSGSMEQKGCGGLQGNHFFHRLKHDSLLRHSKNDTRALVLGDSKRTLLPHFQHALSAVITHSGHDHPQGSSPPCCRKANTTSPAAPRQRSRYRLQGSTSSYRPFESNARLPRKWPTRVWIQARVMPDDNYPVLLVYTSFKGRKECGLGSLEYGSSSIGHGGKTKGRHRGG